MIDISNIYIDKPLAWGKDPKVLRAHEDRKKQLAKKGEWEDYSRAVVKVLVGACHEYA